MFYINDSGEMFMRQEALQTLNSSVLHVVATAVDSGAPPRQVRRLAGSSPPRLNSLPLQKTCPPDGTLYGGGVGHVGGVSAANNDGVSVRQTSVPVLVHVSERLLAPAGSSSPRGAMLAAFAGALALLALLVVALLAYIFRK